MPLIPDLPIHPSNKRKARCEERLEHHIDFLSTQADPLKDKEHYFQVLGHLAKKDYWLYKRLILQERWMDPYLHGDVIIDFCDENNWQDIVLLLPRGCGKTGVLTQTIPAWLATRDPDTTGIIINAREDKANVFAKTAANIVERNAYFRLAYPHIAPGDRWSTTGYFLQGKDNRADAFINSYGVKGNITGAHVRYLLMDDLINREMAKFPNQVRLAEDFFNEALNCLDPGGTLMVCGTRWVTYDFYGKLVEGELVGRSGKRLNVLKLGATREVKDDNGNWFVEIVFPERTYIDLNKNRQKVGYTKEFLDGKKKSDPELYPALYMNEPVSDEQRQFDCDNIETFEDISDLPFSVARLVAVGIEAESQGHAFVSAVKTLQNYENFKIPIRKLSTRREKKEDRIRAAISPLVSDARFKMLDRLWRGKSNLGEELRTFDKGTDDCLDAVSYCIEMARTSSRRPEQKGIELFIAVDPAFTTNSHSDHTAIVVGGFYNDSFYVLECERFRSSKVDVMARRLFNLWFRFSKLVAKDIRSEKQYRGISFARSDRHKRPIVAFDGGAVNAFMKNDWEEID